MAIGVRVPVSGSEASPPMYYYGVHPSSKWSGGRDSPGVSVPGTDAQDGIYVFLTPLRNEFLFAWTGYNLLSKNPLGKPS